jgi:MBG domain/Bacterial Ig-like domain (group 3)/Putative Ig domain/NHL repeat
MEPAAKHAESRCEANSSRSGWIEKPFAAECYISQQVMRLAITLVAILLLGSAAFAQNCSGTGTGGCQQVVCPNGGTTAVSGTVYAPNGTDPIPNILVYIPTATLTAFTDGVSTTNPTIDDVATLVSGSPLVQTTTAADGTFTLTNVPPGSNIPLVIQAGRWRREFVIAAVPSCQTTPLATVTQGGPSSLADYGESTAIRFPQTQGEGDIPKMALATGKADAIECTLRKVGIADTEFTDYTVNVASGGSGPGRVNLFEGAGDSGVKPGSTVHTESTLVGSTSSTFSGSLLGGYNILVLPCQGDSNNYTTADGRNNVIAFTGAGGRIFATHHSAFYIDENSPIDTAANWTSDTTLTNGDGTINTAFSDGSTLAQWLQNIGATTTLGQVALTNVFNDQSGVNSPTESWATLNSDSDVMQLSFYTPVGAAAANQYGRVMFNEYHVDNTTTSSSVTFPNECTGTMAKTQAMSAQEHILEYSLFALMNFAVPVVSTDVSIAITANPATFIGGDQADTITVTVTNNGTSAIGTNPAVGMAVTVPAGLTVISMIDPSGNWSCNTSTLTCTLLNALAANASNSVTLTVSVAANVAAGSASIGATVSSVGFVASTTGNVSLSVQAAPAGTVTGPSEATATATNVGATTTSAGTVTFAISAGTAISSVLVVTEGFTGKDFTNAGTGTCTAQTYSSATTCTVIVNFAPLYPGPRNGAIEIIGPSNALLYTAYISGIGIGPEAIFQPGTQSAVASESGSSNFDDVAVDITGNVYVVDFVNNQILKETYASGSYTQSTAFSGLNGPKGMAIDGAGNIYIAATTGNQVLKETLINGSYTQSTIGSGLASPDGVAVDGSGNVYIADSSNNRVLLETLSNGAYIQSTIAANFSNPWRVTVDVSGDVYVTDTGNDQVLLETLSNGSYTGSTIVTGLNAPRGVAVDGNGTVYIADTGNNRVLEEVLVSGSYVQNVLVSGLNAPRAVTLDEYGNLYIADFGDNTVYRQDYSDPPSLSFATTAVDVASSDSPQTVSLVNFGNAVLTAASPGITGAVDFPQLTGNASDCTTSFSVAAATSCTLRIEFDPQSTGSMSESLVLTDNNLNSAPTTQTIALNGTASSGISIVLSPTSLTAPVIGNSFNQTVSASGGTSPYTFTVSTGSLPAGLSLSAGGVLSGTPTAVGTFTFTIQAQDSTGSGSGGPFTGSQSFSVTIAAPTVVVSPSTLPNGTVTSTYSQALSAAGGSGSYSYAVTSGGLPAGLSLNSTTGALTGTPTAAGVSTFAVTATDVATTGAGAPYTGSQNLSINVGKASATVTLSSLSRTYDGSPLAATASTSPVGLTVTLTYNGSSTPPTTVGAYTVVGTINDPNYQGTATGTLTIGQAQPTVSWTAPAAIAYGTALSATQLNASSGVAGAFVYTPPAGTVLNAGANQTLSVSFTPTDATDYNSATQTVQITVNKAGAAVALSANSNPSLLQSSLTFTATVSSTAETPTGSVSFMDGTALLGSSTLSDGVATLSTSSLTVGSHSVTAVYNGDTDLGTASSSVLSEVVLDFGVSPVSGSGGAAGSGPSQLIPPGGTGNYTIAITPTSGTTFPTITYLTVTGLPPGATATLASSGWSQLTTDSWSFPALAHLSDVSLSFHLPASAASLSAPDTFSDRLPPQLGTFLLVPTLFLLLLFASKPRHLVGRFRWATAAFLLAAISLATMTGLTGCAAHNGFFAQQEQRYIVTITVTTGTLSHSANITLTVE